MTKKELINRAANLMRERNTYRDQVYDLVKIESKLKKEKEELEESASTMMEGMRNAKEAIRKYEQVISVLCVAMYARNGGDEDDKG